MYHAMEAFLDEWGQSYQRAVRITGFHTLEKAIAHAKKRAIGKPLFAKCICSLE